MSYLAPLLEVQELDLAVDVARKRALELPERAALPRLTERIAQVEAELAGALRERAELEQAEHALAGEDEQLGRDLEAAELARYSGRRKDRDEAVAHDASQQAKRDEKAAIEARELALLESIDALEERIVSIETTRASLRAESERLVEAIEKAERELAAVVTDLVESRANLARPLPEPVLVAYERVRLQPRSGGRGATALVDGRCTGCRIQLPSLERKRILEEPEDAAIQCPQCRRVLVRE